MQVIKQGDENTTQRLPLWRPQVIPQWLAANKVKI